MSMRYQIGQKIPVISFIIKGRRRDGSTYERPAVHFMPWEEHVVSSEIVYLTVKEHHKVPLSYDQSGELSCDGYILETSDGERWFNQYPHASYGQLDDSADRHFHRENWKESKYRHYVSLFHYMENLLRGECQLIGSLDWANMLRTQYEELKKRYEELTGYVIVYEPSYLLGFDGTKHMADDFFTITADIPLAIGKKLHTDFIETLDRDPSTAVPISIDDLTNRLKSFVESKTDNEQVKAVALECCDWNQNG